MCPGLGLGYDCIVRVLEWLALRARKSHVIIWTQVGRGFSIPANNEIYVLSLSILSPRSPFKIGLYVAVQNAVCALFCKFELNVDSYIPQNLIQHLLKRV